MEEVSSHCQHDGQILIDFTLIILDSVEELYSKIERELVDEECRQKRRSVSVAELKNIKCGEELCSIFRDNFDSSLYRSVSEHVSLSNLA